jgi:hypothetical protein
MSRDAELVSLWGREGKGAIMVSVAGGALAGVVSSASSQPPPRAQERQRKGRERRVAATVCVAVTGGAPAGAGLLSIIVERDR